MFKVKPGQLTVRYQDIPSFGTSDERLLDKGWHVALIGGHHRDSEAIDVANTLELEERLEAVDPDQEHWGGMRANHWAVGWYHHIVVDPNHEPVMRVLREAWERLEDCASLNDDRLSELEVEWHWDGKCRHECPFEHCKLCGDAVSEYRTICDDCKECED